MNRVVLAKLQQLTADAVLAHERILAKQRSTPTVGRSQTQLALQRQARELQDQLQAWETIFQTAVQIDRDAETDAMEQAK